MKERKNCSLCKRQKTGMWFLTTDCKICRAQWRAFYAGHTRVSPLMLAITVDQIKAAEKRREES